MSGSIESTSTKIEKAVHRNDQPLGKQGPGAPLAVVGFSYLLALHAVTAVVALGAWIS